MINSIQAIQSTTRRLESILDKLDPDTMKTVTEAICELDAVEFNLANDYNSHNSAIQALNNKGVYERGPEIFEARV